MTKTEMIAKHLKENGSITSRDAIQLFGETRLSNIINYLRKKGWGIETEAIRFINKYGMECTNVKYILHNEA